MITVLQTPFFDVADSGNVATQSRASAALSQLPYLFQRFDVTVTALLNSGGLVRIQGGPWPTTIAIGDQVYLGAESIADPPRLLRDASYEVTAVTSQSDITLNTNFSADLNPVGVVTFITSKLNDYALLLNFVNANTSGPLFATDLVYNFQMDKRGILFYDASPVLSSVLQSPDIRPFRAIDLTEQFILEQRYRIQFQEYYGGVLIGARADAGSTHMAVNAKKQALEYGGSNLWDRLPAAAGSNLGFDKTQALRNFDQNFILNTSAGSESWISSPPEIAVGIATGVQRNSRIATFNENVVAGSIPRNSQVFMSIQYRSVGNTFARAGAVTWRVLGLPDANDQTIGAFVEIAQGNVQVPANQAINRAIFLRGVAPESCKAIGVRVSIAGGDFNIACVVRGLTASSMPGGFVFLNKFHPPILLQPTGLITFDRRKSLAHFWDGWTNRLSWIMDIDFAARTGFAGVQIIERGQNINQQTIGSTALTQYGNQTGINVIGLRLTPTANISRQVWAITGTLDSGGFDQIIVTGPPATQADFVLGVVINYQNTAGTRKKSGIITSIGLSGMNTSVTTNQVFDTNLGGGTAQVPDQYKWHQVTIRENGGAVFMSEQFYMRVIRESNQCKNPIMLEWLNDEGASDQWLFSLDQEVQMNSDDGEIYDSPVTFDQEFTPFQIGREVTDTHETVTVIAEGLETLQLRALHQIKQSSQVRVWLDRTGTQFVQARVTNSLQTSYANKLGAAYSISIQLEFPANFSLFDSVEYQLILGQR